MEKERIVPAHPEKYIVCDFCGLEIEDYSSTEIIHKDGTPTKHFHNMYSGGSKGVVKKTCFKLFNEKLQSM